MIAQGFAFALATVITQALVVIFVQQALFIQPVHKAARAPHDVREASLLSESSIAARPMQPSMQTKATAPAGAAQTTHAEHISNPAQSLLHGVVDAEQPVRMRAPSVTSLEADRGVSSVESGALLMTALRTLHAELSEGPAARREGRAHAHGWQGAPPTPPVTRLSAPERSPSILKDVDATLSTLDEQLAKLEQAAKLREQAAMLLDKAQVLHDSVFKVMQGEDVQRVREHAAIKRTEHAAGEGTERERSKEPLAAELAQGHASRTGAAGMSGAAAASTTAQREGASVSARAERLLDEALRMLASPPPSPSKLPLETPPTPPSLAKPPTRTPTSTTTTPTQTTTTTPRRTPTTTTTPPRRTPPTTTQLSPPTVPPPPRRKAARDTADWEVEWEEEDATARQAAQAPSVSAEETLQSLMKILRGESKGGESKGGEMGSSGRKTAKGRSRAKKRKATPTSSQSADAAPAADDDFVVEDVD